MGKGETTRTAILESASRLATQVGLDGLSIGGLATELDLSKSGLFAHFASKENLQVEVVTFTAALFVEQVIRPALMKPRGEARLRALFQGWIRWSEDEEQNPGGCFFVAAAAEFDDRPGPVRDVVARELRSLSSVFARAARIAVEEGQFKKNLDTEAFAQEVFGIVLSFNQFRRLFREPKARSRAERAFEALLERSRS